MIGRAPVLRVQRWTRASQSRGFTREGRERTLACTTTNSDTYLPLSSPPTNQGILDLTLVHLGGIPETLIGRASSTME